MDAVSSPSLSFLYAILRTVQAKRLLGERSKTRRPFARVLLSAVVLAMTAFITLVPVEKSISATLINHGKTRVLRAGHQ